ncbi:MAG: E3 binding domain-containing protein, partial [Victivallaceae bacterium]|nr:E3 binding domain-containing protein [Victivallaceae bacterium]
MADIVMMPQMGVSEESALLAEWKVKEGDVVKQDDPLFSLETGKSSFEELSKLAGTILKILVPAGEEVAVGSPVAVIGKPGEKFDVPGGAAPAAAPAAEAPAEAPAAAPAAAPAPAVAAAAAPSGEAKFASPRARKLAADTGVDIASCSATGPDGRVIERDVKAALASGATAAPAAASAAPASSAPAAAAPAATPAAASEDQPISRTRTVIAENMRGSLPPT